MLTITHGHVDYNHHEQMLMLIVISPSRHQIALF